MNRSKTQKWATAIVCGVLAAVTAIGCNPLNLAAFIFARDERVAAPHPLTFDKDGPKKDKDEVVVMLLPHLGPNPQREFITADRDLADKLSRILPELAKENKDKRKVRVINPSQVDRFKMTTPNWKQMSGGEIGEKLGADYVLDIELANMRLYQPNTGNQVKIYEGRAEVNVTIFEVTANGSEYKDSYPLSFAFPRGVAGNRDPSAISEAEFKKQYMESLARQIALQHVDYKRGIGIDDDR